MKTRDNMSAVIEGLQRDHGLLAAYLEATERIDWRALHRRVVIDEPPKPSNVEAHQPQLPEVAPSTTSTVAFRRANLVRKHEWNAAAAQGIHQVRLAALLIAGMLEWAWAQTAWTGLVVEAPRPPVSGGSVQALGEDQEPAAPGDEQGDGCVGVNVDLPVRKFKSMEVTAVPVGI